MRKYEAIDLMKLYSLGSNNGWNSFLTDCFDKMDINKLAKVRYQICAGMDDLAKQNKNTEKINIFFIRLNRSIELTAKKIIRKKFPLPHDNTVSLKKDLLINKTDALEAKRKRDRELQQFFIKSAY